MHSLAPDSRDIYSMVSCHVWTEVDPCVENFNTLDAASQLDDAVYYASLPRIVLVYHAVGS